MSNNNTLIDNLTNILNQKNTYITPNNIRQNITVLNITGNLEPDKPDQSKTVDPAITVQNITADVGYELYSVIINAVTSNIDPNITAENIKNGVTILNITGNLESTFKISDGMKFGYSRVSDFPSLDTSDVIDMSNMFTQCYNLVNAPSLNTINTTNMSWMFSSCFKLVNISNFDTSNVTNIYRMFSQCFNLVSVPDFDTSNVINMAEMFYSCENLNTIPNFNTSKVTNMSRMFYSCSNLTSIPEFSTPNVTDMSYMFQSCRNLTSIPELNTSNVFSVMSLCSSCNNLSNESIQNIVNMCLNSHITTVMYKNLSNTNSYSPLYKTIFDNSYYSNRLTELDAAGWTY